MERYIVILIWILIISVISLSIPTKCVSKKEPFYTYFGYYKNYCGSCGHRSRTSCSKCTNCGWGMDSNGAGKCMPGDQAGPWFNDNVMYWNFSDPYAYYPGSHLYPVVKTRSIYPTVRRHNQ